MNCKRHAPAGKQFCLAATANPWRRLCLMKAVPLIITLVLATALSVAAAERPPIPKPRPPLGAAQEAPSPAAPPAPVPRLRPDEAAAVPADPDADAAAPAPPAEAEKAGWPPEMVADGRARCATLLSGVPVVYKALGPIGDEGGCGAPAPILITEVAGVALVPPATQTCDMAAALAGWIGNSVKPAAREKLHTEVTEIRTATSYACRRRNNGSSGKMSEHSKANGLDMAGFSFAGATKAVVGGGNWGEGLLGALGLSGHDSFLDDVRKSACTYFTTVLGPGSDPYHGDHFHVDVLRRKGDYRICQ